LGGTTPRCAVRAARGVGVTVDRRDLLGGLRQRLAPQAEHVALGSTQLVRGVRRTTDDTVSPRSTGSTDDE